MERRNFLKTTGLSAAGVSSAGKMAFSDTLFPFQNKLPCWKGFNLPDLLTKNSTGNC